MTTTARPSANDVSTCDRVGIDSRGPAFSCDPRNRGGGRFRQLARDDHRVGLDDSRLLDCDGLDRRTEVLLVVEADRRDCADGRWQDVGCIEPATESDFDDGDVDAGTSKQFEGDHRRDLEERRIDRKRSASAQTVHAVEHVSDDGLQFFGFDRCRPDDEALVQLREMGRRVACAT